MLYSRLHQKSVHRRFSSQAQRGALQVCRIHKALDKQAKTVLTTPEDVTLECLMLLRKPHLESLKFYLSQPETAGDRQHNHQLHRTPFPTPETTSPWQQEQKNAAAVGGKQRVPIHVGDVTVMEEGPLATCAEHMDAAARRVLPGHLLRRCRILSSLQLGGTCRQRVAITGKNGEEAVFNVFLIRDQQAMLERITQHPANSTATEVLPGTVPANLGHSVMQASSGTDLDQLLRQAATRAGAAAAGSAHSDTSSSTASTPSLGSVGGSWDGDVWDRMPSNGMQDPVGSSGSHASSSASDDESGGVANGGPTPTPSLWKVERICRDTSNDMNASTSAGPHPRLSPETVILEQLREFQQGSLAMASAYFSTNSPWRGLDSLRSMVRQPCHHLLLTHSSAQLMEGALPDARSFLQHVQLDPGNIKQATPMSFVWRLALQSNGCWTVDDIVPLWN